MSEAIEDRTMLMLKHERNTQRNENNYLASEIRFK